MRDSLMKVRAKIKKSKGKINLEEKPETEKVKIVVSGEESISNEIPLALLSKTRRKTINRTKYILDADIEGCFDNIDHK